MILRHRGHQCQRLFDFRHHSGTTLAVISPAQWGGLVIPAFTFMSLSSKNCITMSLHLTAQKRAAGDL